MTHPQFCKFHVDWDIYKGISSLSPERYNAHLYNACDETVQTSFVNTKPKFLELTEEQLLKTIENIVTKQINPAVYCMNFGALQQFEHETIQDFDVRLQGVSQKFPLLAVRHKLGISELWSRGFWVPTLKASNGIWGKAPKIFCYLTLVRL